MPGVYYGGEGMTKEDIDASSLADTLIAVQTDEHTTIAKEILAGTQIVCDGSPITDVMSVFENAYSLNHSGDNEVLHTCIYAMALQSCKNTKGLHAKATGKKGSGKSTAIAAALHLAPHETVCKGSFSDMALFRKVRNIRHPRIMLDDVVLSEKQTANIKRATGAFQEKCEHSTIVENKDEVFFIPERSVFLMTSVNEEGDDQLVDRFIALGTGVGYTDDESYAAWENEKRCDGREDLVTNESVRVARAILRYLATEEFIVHTPNLQFAYTTDRRLMNMVWDLMSAHAILYHLQRRYEEAAGVIHVWADERDLNAIIHVSMFNRLDAASETRLTPAEQRLNVMLQDDLLKRNVEDKIYTEQEIANLYGKTMPTVRGVLYGRDGSQQRYTKGLMAKVTWLEHVPDDVNRNRLNIKVHKHASSFFGQFAVLS
jgi:energy-coupling factor transporter ATP-binding protein EcfA2